MTESDPDIFELALACYRNPLAHQGRLALATPLPAGMDRLLWLANGSPEILEAAVRQTGAKTEELREAARFLVQQLCFARGATHYRALGLEPDATPEQIKEHHRLLIRLFHPDRGIGRANWTDHYASRVNEAWTALSRPQSRADYDDRLRRPPAPVLDANAVRTSESSTPPSRGGRPRRRKVGRSRARVAMPRRWLPVLVVGGFALIAILLVGGIPLFEPHPAPIMVAPTAPVVSESPVVMPEPPTAELADHSAITSFLVTPDWQALRQREQQVRQEIVQARDTREPPEQTRQDRLATDEALLEQMRMERAGLEERLRAEQIKSEQAWAERLMVERARLERLKAEPVDAQRLTVDRQRLEALQSAQARAERVADALRAERARLEETRTEPNRLERQRLEPQFSARHAAQPDLLERVVVAAPAVTPAVTPPAPDTALLTVRELDDLIGRYTSAYQQDDLDRLMALFAPGARGKGGSDRASIHRDYAVLFDTYRIRRIQLHDLRWNRRGPSAHATARYELWLRPRDSDSVSQWAGNIRFEASKQDGRVLIESIDYDWPAP